MWTATSRDRALILVIDKVWKEIVHDFQKVGRLNSNQIYHSLSRLVYWVRLFYNIKRIITQGKACQLNEAEKKNREGLSQPNAARV